MWGKTEYMAMMSNNSSTDIVKFMAPGSEVQDMGGGGGLYGNMVLSIYILKSDLKK